MADEHDAYHLTDLAVALHARRSPEAVLAAFAEAVPGVAERPGIELVDGVLTFAPGALADDEAEVWTRRAAILATALENAAAHDSQTRAEAMLRALIEQLPAVSYIAQPISGNPIYISPQLEQLFGSKVSDWMQGMDGWAAQIHPDDRDEVLRTYTAAVAAAVPYDGEYRLIDTGGQVRWVWDTAVTIVDGDGTPQAVHGVIFEVTKRKLAEQALNSSQTQLREAEARYRNLVERLPLAIYIDALDATATSIYNSPKNAEITGYTHEQWVADPDLFARIVHPDDRERVMAALSEAHDAHTEFCCEYRIVRPDGSLRWLRDESVIVEDEAGVPLYRQGYLLDITDRRQAEERFAHLAYHDALTSLPNRILFRERLELELERAARDRAGLVVLYVDLDDFKLVNDNLGHGAGDELLCAVAERLRRAVRPGDLVARQGGDEFLVLLAGVEHGPSASLAETGERIGHQLLAALSTPFAVVGTEVYCSASVGVSLYPVDAKSAETLLKHADVAMYRAKDAGRHACHVYSTGAGAGAGSIATAARLARAIEGGDLTLHYQPIVDLATGATVGCEALVRWRDGDALVPPGKFIPLAERTGLIAPLSDWVIAEACRQSRAWQGRGLELPISVNFSGALWDLAAVRRFLDTLAGFELPAGRITVELTESTAMANPAETRRIMAELRRRAVPIAIDDFGTGHSSLGRLQEMSVSTLKIDRSFIAKLGKEPGRVLVETMVGLAQGLGLKSLAEGIETESQLEFLRAAGCPLGQGYLWSGALPAAELEAHYRGRRAA
jgi:diguanylate cyclase (GGDEF)-like protein/PAS domain S-box-containing protein